MPEVAEEKVQDRLRRLVAANQLSRAGKQLSEIAADDRYGDYRTQVLGFNSRMTVYLEDQIGGAVAPDALARTRNQLSMDLLTLIDELPDEAALTAEAQAPAGVSEGQLKRRLFWMLLIGKLTVLFFAFFLVDTGSGLAEKEFPIVLGVLIPMFGVYLAMMFESDTKRRHILKPEDIRVTKDFARKAYLVVGFYPVILCFILYLRAVGVIGDVTALTVALGLAESGWGVYVGKVIVGMFREG